jgi:hypothetical protein
MQFTTTTGERRQHTPYRLENIGGVWVAYHAKTGHRLLVADTEEQALMSLSSRTEPA